MRLTHTDPGAPSWRTPRRAPPDPVGPEPSSPGGSVLGIGAVVTLAAWTDDNWAGSTFSGGTFAVESSASGIEGTFESHDTSGDALALDFRVDAANLSPTDSVAAPIVLRIDAESTHDATVALSSASGTGANAENLTYGIVTVADTAACTVDAEGTSRIVPAGTALGATAGARSFDLFTGPADSAGAPVVLCFQVTAGADLQQGGDASALWQFTATTTD